ncbi:MAG: hypothetical protein HRT88_02385 [Lentisphaeraceae bacterium]|nr:hypothetical protein [Lentisphaeraceae bacterium]
MEKEDNEWSGQRKSIGIGGFYQAVFQTGVNNHDFCFLAKKILLTFFIILNNGYFTSSAQPGIVLVTANWLRQE